MATHPKHATNGNGNGHGNSGDARLQKLLAHHEGIASAIRTTIEALNGTAKVAKQKTGASVIAAALAIDSARKVGRPKKNSPARVHGMTKQKRAQRERTGALLNAFTARDAIPADSELRRMSGGLTRHGYLRKTATGLFRTAKPYVVDPAAASA
jgi:hypothetical protein